MSPIVHAPEPETIRMSEACRRLGISQKHGYDLAAEGAFPCRTLRLGRRVVIMRRDFEGLFSGEAPSAAPPTATDTAAPETDGFGPSRPVSPV
jgi:predicted DNA-binding transcriptional regulator AlpA